MVHRLHIICCHTLDLFALLIKCRYSCCCPWFCQRAMRGARLACPRLLLPAFCNQPELEVVGLPPCWNPRYGFLSSHGRIHIHIHSWYCGICWRVPKMDRTCGGGGRVRCEMSAMIARDDERGKAIDGRSNCGRVDDGSRVLRPQRRRRAGGVLSTLWGPAFAFLFPLLFPLLPVLQIFCSPC